MTAAEEYDEALYGREITYSRGEMTVKYMLLIYMNEDAMTEEERAACYVESTQVAQDLSSRGQFLGANPLHPIATATSVQIREGKQLVTDGPFAETREQLGGYYLVDVENLDQAIAIASRLPPAKKGTVEIRPIIELSGLPEAAAAARPTAG